MNQTQSNTPSQPSDDGTVHFELNHEPTSTTPVNPTLTRSSNFVDETETGLFDFDLEDLENLFNTSGRADSHAPQDPTSATSADTLTAIDPITNLPPIDLDTPTPFSSAPHTDSSPMVSNHENSVENSVIDFEKVETTHTVETAPHFTLEKPSDPKPPITNTDDNPHAHATLAPATNEMAHDTPISYPANEAMALGTATTGAILATNALASTDKPITQKKGFFSQFSNKKTKPTPETPATPIAPITPTAMPIASDNPTPPITPKIVTKKPAKNNKPLLILLGLLLLGALAWLASQFFAEPEPAPQPTPKASPVAQAPATVASPIANSAVTATVATAPLPQVSSATASVATVDSSSKNLVKPEEILSAPLPKDNAIAKEELDRLADQSKQLSEQEKMKAEQLRMMNELASKKEERIAILEKQIAQAEAQKAQAKK